MNEARILQKLSPTKYFYVKCYFIVGVIALRHLPTLLNVDVDVEVISA